jgi:hypothetical protein
VLPPSLPLSAEFMSKSGVYLFWLAESILIIVQPEASSELLIQIFGTSDWEDIEAMNNLPKLS